MTACEDAFINGDGETCRDFCYVANAVQANIGASTNTAVEAKHEIYNVAVDDRSTLNAFFRLIKIGLVNRGVEAASNATHREFLSGDVQHSQADISEIKKLLGVVPTHTLTAGLTESTLWYVA